MRSSVRYSLFHNSFKLLLFISLASVQGVHASTESTTPPGEINVRDGSLSFQDWILSYVRDPHMSASSEGRKNLKLRVATFKSDKSDKKQEIPRIVYSAESHKAVALTWPGLPQSPNDNPPKTLSLVLIDLNVKDVSAISPKVLWPEITGAIGLRNSGVYFKSTDGNFYYRPIDWQNGALGDSRVIAGTIASDTWVTSDDGLFYIIRNGNQFLLTPLGLIPYTGDDGVFNVVKDNDPDQRNLKELGPEDLFKSLKSRKRDPLYDSKSLENRLSAILGSTERSWAIVTYEEGQMAEEPVYAFFDKLKDHKLATSRRLEDIQLVNFFSDSRPFDKKDERELASHFMALLGATESKKTILFLKDFPTHLPEEAENGAAVSQFEKFWKIFEQKKCLEMGRCRVVMTMRKEVFEVLKERARGKLEIARVESMPRLSRDVAIKAITKRLKTLEGVSGKVFAPGALEQLLEEDAQHSKGIKTQQPRRGSDLVMDLLDYPSVVPTQEITMGIVNSFIDQRFGLDQLKKQFDPEKSRRFLHERIAGRTQHRVIEAVFSQLQRIKSGLVPEKGPLAKFIFIGPSSVGKTELAFQLAESIGGPGSLIRIPMGDWQGFDADSEVGKKIASSRKEQPRVVLFDDVDQASTNTQEKLADILFEGVYAENTKDALSFKNCIVILTANWGHALIEQKNDIEDGFLLELRSHLQGLVALGTAQNAKDRISQRLWSRMESSLYVFPLFTTDALLELAILKIKKRNTELKNLEFLVDPGVLLFLTGDDPKVRVGARALVAVLDNELIPSVDDTFKNTPGLRRILVRQNNAGLFLDTGGSKDFDSSYEKLKAVYAMPLLTESDRDAAIQAFKRTGGI